MYRTCKFLLGVCVGANMLAGLVAHCLLYGTTGKLPALEKGRARLVAPDEAVARLRSLADKVTEGRHG
jgi:hypothetical protein